MIEVRLPIKAGGPIITKNIHNPLYSYKFKSAHRIVRDFTPVVNAQFFDAFQDPAKPNPRPNSHVGSYSFSRSAKSLLYLVHHIHGNKAVSRTPASVYQQHGHS